MTRAIIKMVEEWFHARPCAVSFVTKNIDGSCWADSFIFALMYPSTLRTFMRSFFKPKANKYDLDTNEYDLEIKKKEAGEVIRSRFDAQKNILEGMLNDLEDAIGISLGSGNRSNTAALESQKELYLKAYNQFETQFKSGRSAIMELMPYMQKLVTLYNTNSFQEGTSCPDRPPGRQLYELMFRAVTGHTIETKGAWKFLAMADVFHKGLRPYFYKTTLANICDTEYFSEHGNPPPENEVLFVVNKINPTLPKQNFSGAMIAPYVLQGNSFKYVCRSAMVRSTTHAMAFGTCDDLEKTQDETTWVFFDGQEGGFLAYGGYGSFPRSAFRNPSQSGTETKDFEITYNAENLNVFLNDSLIIYQRVR